MLALGRFRRSSVDDPFKGGHQTPRFRTMRVARKEPKKKKHRASMALAAGSKPRANHREDPSLRGATADETQGTARVPPKIRNSTTQMTKLDARTYASTINCLCWLPADNVIPGVVYRPMVSFSAKNSKSASRACSALLRRDAFGKNAARGRCR